LQTAVFLDRDNTLIANDGDLGDPERVALVEGVAGGLQALRGAGYRLVVVTNQAGVARGEFTEADVDAVHQRIGALLDQTTGQHNLVERFYYCPYHPEGSLNEYRRDHPWRKPHPGMLLQAARDLGLDLRQCWMIGDQPRDVAAGLSAGCRTVLVGRDGEAAADPEATVTVDSFGEAVREVLSQTPKGGGGSGAAAVADPDPPANVQWHEALRRSIGELTEELRSERLRRVEFSLLKMGAAFCQLLVVLLAVLGLLQLGNNEVFFKWMIAAVLLQLLVITLLLLDQKGG
jgi:D,D-heptose 1,7-bisphosphate phosphatase